jgi:hypothetical protein
VNDVFANYNEFNDETRLQLEQINRTIAEMLSDKRLPAIPRRRIGYFTEEQREKGEDWIE